MRVVVVGYGVAGRSAIAFLRNRLVNENNLETIKQWKLKSNVVEFIIIDPYIYNPNNHTHKYTGLWRPSLCHLKNLLGSTYEEKIGQYLSPVLKSGYRSMNGRWLTRPTVPDQSDPQLQFLSNRVLLEALDPLHDHSVVNQTDGKTRNSSKSIEVRIQHIQASLESIQPYPGNGYVVIVKTDHSKHNHIEADMLLICDGYKSKARSILYSTEPISHPRGYSITRGIATIPNEIEPIESFQTWGLGCRFSCVPVGKNTYQWFAAIEDRIINDYRFGKNIMKGYTVDYPLAQSELLLGSDYIKIVEHVTKSYHQPIPELLARTDYKTVTVNKAFAMKSMLFKESESASYVKFTNSIVFLGDAYHTLDPILAQGAGLAIEDGANLSDSIYRLGFNRNAIIDFEDNRLDRLHRLRRLSALATVVGRISNPTIVSLRDNLFRFTPNMIKTYLFDRYLTIALETGRDIDSFGNPV